MYGHRRFQEASDAIKYANDPDWGCARYRDPGAGGKFALPEYQRDAQRIAQTFSGFCPDSADAGRIAALGGIQTGFHLDRFSEAMDRIAAAAKGLQAAAGPCKPTPMSMTLPKSSGIADLKVGGDPLATAGIGDKCRKATETITWTKKTHRSRSDYGFCQRRDASADALAAASKGRYLVNAWVPLPHSTVAGEDTLERWQRAFAKLKKKEAVWTLY